MSSDNFLSERPDAFRHPGVGQTIIFKCMPCNTNKGQLGAKKRRYAGVLMTVCATCADAIDARRAKGA